MFIDFLTCKGKNFLIGFLYKSRASSSVLKIGRNQRRRESRGKRVKLLCMACYRKLPNVIVQLYKIIETLNDQRKNVRFSQQQNELSLLLRTLHNHFLSLPYAHPFSKTHLSFFIFLGRSYSSIFFPLSPSQYCISFSTLLSKGYIINV